MQRITRGEHSDTMGACGSGGYTATAVRTDALIESYIMANRQSWETVDPLMAVFWDSSEGREDRTDDIEVERDGMLVQNIDQTR